MAVDTRQKRMSMIAFGDGVILHTLFEADGTVSLDDRQHLLGCYSGIGFGLPVAVAAAAVIFMYGKVRELAGYHSYSNPIQRYGK